MNANLHCPNCGAPTGCCGGPCEECQQKFKAGMAIAFLSYPCGLCGLEGEFPKYQVLTTQLVDASQPERITGNFHRHLCPTCVTRLDDFLMAAMAQCGKDLQQQRPLT